MLILCRKFPKNILGIHGDGKSPPNQNKNKKYLIATHFLDVLVSVQSIEANATQTLQFLTRPWRPAPKA